MVLLLRSFEALPFSECDIVSVLLQNIPGPIPITSTVDSYLITYWRDIKAQDGKQYCIQTGSVGPTRIWRYKAVELPPLRRILPNTYDEGRQS